MQLTCEEFNELSRRIRSEPTKLSECEQKSYAQHFMECQGEHRRKRENLADDIRADVLMQ